MAGLYRTAFANDGMTPDQTNGHWKREQDNYLSQIGAMDLIRKDPMASLGYRIRSANPNKTLDMGSDIDPTKAYGLYQFRPNTEDRVLPRYDGTLNVDVGLAPQHYGSVIAHELGHVGSRNSQSDPEVISDPAGEEIRQRFIDIANNPPGSRMRMEGIQILMENYGLNHKDVLQGLKEAEAKLGIKKPPAKKTKKKKLITSEVNSEGWEPVAGTD